MGGFADIITEQMAATLTELEEALEESAQYVREVLRVNQSHDQKYVVLV